MKQAHLPESAISSPSLPSSLSRISDQPTTMLAYDPQSPYPSNIMNNFRFPAVSPLPFNNSQPLLYDSRDRQRQILESQRRERIEFLKKREWARRVAEWFRQTDAQYQSDISSFGRPWSVSPQPVPDTNYAYSTPYSPPVPFPQVEQEEEPYIIYCSSPSSSLSSFPADDSKHTNIGLPSSPSLGGGVVPKRAPGHHRRRSSASTRTPRRSPSLSSIFEVPEED
ncbi:hypothetical protein ID866_4306 [Astraeus odoratus]|nr:hypothetical protein ID866_4306 [Astraeus odoratus]